MAQLIWYVAQTRDTGNLKKVVEAHFIGYREGDLPHPIVQMERWVTEWAGLEILHRDGPYWVPSFFAAWATEFRLPKWRKNNDLQLPPGIDHKAWRNRYRTLDEIKAWRDGYLAARGKVWLDRRLQRIEDVDQDC